MVDVGNCILPDLNTRLLHVSQPLGITSKALNPIIIIARRFAVDNSNDHRRFRFLSPKVFCRLACSRPSVGGAVRPYVGKNEGYLGREEWTRPSLPLSPWLPFIFHSPMFSFGTTNWEPGRLSYLQTRIISTIFSWLYSALWTGQWNAYNVHSTRQFIWFTYSLIVN